MTRKELEQIIQDGESYTIEFKESVNSDLPKEMAAFANSSGGRIFIGIKDDNTIKGIDINNSLLSQVQNMATACDPSVSIRTESFENVLIITIKEGGNKPYRCNKGFYIRNGVNSQKMSTREITEFIQTEGKILFDEIVRDDLDVDAIFDEKLLTSFLNRARIRALLDNHSILQNLGVLTRRNGKHYFNNAGVLFFTKEPANYFYHSIVTCVLFKGIERHIILDRKDFRGDLVSNLNDAMLFLQQHLQLRYEIRSLQREELLEIPEVALREVVLNAVCHRDYFDKRANVTISIFDDRVEVTNPGGLPSGLAPKDFGTKSIARNPLIASLFQRLGYIEKMGTGILRIKEALKQADIEEPEFSFDTFFTVKIYRSFSYAEETPVESSEKTSGKSSEKSSEKVLRLLKEEPASSAVRIAAEIGISDRAVEKIISGLKKENKIRRVGPAKGGHWEIIGKE